MSHLIRIPLTADNTFCFGAQIKVEPRQGEQHYGEQNDRVLDQYRDEDVGHQCRGQDQRECGRQKVIVEE